MLKITTTQIESGQYVAWLTDDPPFSATGQTEDEAIGALIIYLSFENNTDIELTTDPTGVAPE